MKASKVDRSPEICGRSQPFEALRLGGEGGVAEAVVSVDGAGPSPGGANAFVDQVSCRYAPHVVSLTVGDTLEVHNGDELLHNVHAIWTSPDPASWFNLATPTKGISVRRPVTKGGIARLVCDAGHTWMSGWIHAFDHDLHAVTGDDGTFRIERVPEGPRTLRIWHEGWRIEGDDGGRPRFSAPVVLTRPVDVSAEGEVEVEIEMSDG